MLAELGFFLTLVRAFTRSVSVFVAVLALLAEFASASGRLLVWTIFRYMIFRYMIWALAKAA